MTQDELKNLLTIAGWTCRVKADEVILQVCYFCGNDRWNLELNAGGGMYHCWVCKKGGRLSDVLKLITGETYHIPVSKKEPTHQQVVQATTGFASLSVGKVPSATLYLARRGLPPDVADRYGVVVCTEKGHQLESRISFPLREFWSQEVVGWSGRTYTNQRPKYISTLVHKVITGWRLRDRDMPAVIVEGPFDGLAVHRAGYQTAVLSGIGSHGILEWAARLSPITPVVLMLDPDAQQQMMQLYWTMQPVLGSRLSMVNYKDQEGDPGQLSPDIIKSLVDGALRGHGHY